MTMAGFEEVTMLRLAACLECCSNHPLAAVIVGHAAANKVPLHDTACNSQTLPGEE